METLVRRRRENEDEEKRTNRFFPSISGRSCSQRRPTQGCREGRQIVSKELKCGEKEREEKRIEEETHLSDQRLLLRLDVEYARLDGVLSDELEDADAEEE
jgi:hypothetical protein